MTLNGDEDFGSGKGSLGADPHHLFVFSFTFHNKNFHFHLLRHFTVSATTLKSILHKSLKNNKLIQTDQYQYHNFHTQAAFSTVMMDSDQTADHQAGLSLSSGFL